MTRGEGTACFHILSWSSVGSLGKRVKAVASDEMGDVVLSSAIVEMHFECVDMS
jgi:hypothetical protein